MAVLKTYECKKCGALITEKAFKHMEFRHCPKCQEPDDSFYEFDRADWSTPMDIYEKKGE